MGRIQPIILAGGDGSRLWPVSRQTYPKQFLGLAGGKSLVAETFLRISRLANIFPPYVVVGEEHRFIVKSQLDELDLQLGYEILIEPLGRDTGAAICGCVAYSIKTRGEEVPLLFLPADHVIANPEVLYEGVYRGLELVGRDRIVTFGVEPKGPETGYGYIRKGTGHEVRAFVEKPAYEQACAYLASGEYCWNSGIFFFTGKTFVQEALCHIPEMYKDMELAIENGAQDGEFFRFDSESMFEVENSSIDYALIERSSVVSVIELDLQWVDVGSWKALWQIIERDFSGNVCRGDVVAHETNDSIVIAEERLVTTVGIKDTIVVETPDAVLVASMKCAQSVRQVVEHLRFSERREFKHHHTTYRPWGSVRMLESQERYRINKLHITPEAGISLQKHFNRFEHWVVVSGVARVTKGEETFLLHEDESCDIPMGVVHRLENPGKTVLIVIETQIGSYLGEDDIERLDENRDES